ncbi:unnamed protein product [Cuscuta campestris]|uniref:Uncharacterized protein n=1 Tax=Cuscuta campestris TaxID=132261 RepID=A0A484MIX6_9ASTE|nr:unnamed protein product [Cuscuta campestris]
MQFELAVGIGVGHRCVGPALAPSHPAFGSSITPSQVDEPVGVAKAVSFMVALSGWDAKTFRESLFNMVGSAFVCNGFLCSVPFRWHPYLPTAEFCRVPARVGTKGLAFD